jgi:hypothetical protein
VWFSLVGDSAFFGKHTAERLVLFVLQDGHVMTSVQKILCLIPLPSSEECQSTPSYPTSWP